MGEKANLRAELAALAAGKAVTRLPTAKRPKDDGNPATRFSDAAIGIKRKRTTGKKPPKRTKGPQPTQQPGARTTICINSIERLETDAPYSVRVHATDIENSNAPIILHLTPTIAQTLELNAFYRVTPQQYSDGTLRPARGTKIRLMKSAPSTDLTPLGRSRALSFC